MQQKSAKIYRYPHCERPGSASVPLIPRAQSQHKPDSKFHIKALEPARSEQTLIIWYKRWRCRRQLARELLREPDTVLGDAGFDRASLEREIAKPFWKK